MTEIWRDIKDYEGVYQVSNLGNIRRISRKFRGGYKLINQPKMLNPWFNDNNGYVVCLTLNRKQKFFQVNRLVYSTFVKEVKSTEIIHHKDGDKSNNKVDNLFSKEWKGYYTHDKKYT